ncbi:MAG: FHA domain-containing protein [Lachnospiraceae bacterium]|nr:FHA domain-containing protein [Lachnospiraceae bacterium]
MNISFRKNLNKNYMVIEKVSDFSENNFQVQMLLQNEIPTLLRFSFEIINGKAELFYDISSRQVFDRQFEISKMTFENLRTFCFSVRTLVRALEEYLLDPNNIILKKECIFTDPEANSYFFCYHPYYRGDILAELRELFNHILQIIDYEDEKAVRLAYEIHSKIQTDNFVLTDIMNVLQQDFSGSIRRIGKIEVEELEFEEDVQPVPVPVVEEATFLEKVSAYLKGRNLIDILEDINNGELRHKIRNEKPFYPSKEPFLLSEQNKKEPVKLLPGESFMEESVYPSGGTSSGGGTVLLGKAGNSNRRLVGIKGQEGQCIEVSKLPFTIGKLAGFADEVIDLPSISRLHTRIYPANDQGEYQIEDLNSTNGTFLNEQKLMPYTKTILREGDVIRLAGEEYRFC